MNKLVSFITVLFTVLRVTAADIIITEANKNMYISNGILNIGLNNTYTIDENANITISSVVFDLNAYNNNRLGKLKINGTLNIESSQNIVLKGIIENNGFLTIGSSNVNLYCNQENGIDFMFTNKGTVYAEATTTSSFNIVANNAENFNVQNGEIFKTKNYNVNLTTNYNQIHLGKFNVADGNMKIDMQSGFSTNADQLIVDGTLTLEHGVQELHIKESAFLDIINTSTWNSFKTVTEEGSSIFVKNLDPSKKIQFTLGAKSTFSICTNPTKNAADYGGGNYMVTMGSGSQFNYIISEYTYNGVEKNPSNTNISELNLKGEGDVNVGNYTIELKRYNSSLTTENGLVIHNFIDLLKYLLKISKVRDSNKVYLNGAYDNVASCEDAYTNHKSELLPIELTRLYGISEGEKVKLVWQTASETNNDYFVISRSFNGVDFNEIDVISGQGTTTEITNYEYVDDCDFTGVVYYKLKQVDFNGASTESKIIAVNIKLQNQALKIIENEIKWSADVKDICELIITDELGRIRYCKSFSNSENYSIPISLNSGIYVATVLVNGKQYSQKFVR
ncbi:MAG: hypothetical protein MJ198_00830 [Bacteroidales bacterium]|nr:hypothetical protein [Bacteroidales bacterium]